MYLQLSLGLTKFQIGRLAAVVAFVQLLLNYPAGMLADRFHPVRVQLWVKIGLIVISPLNLIWLFGNFTPDTAFNIYCVLAAIDLPLGLIYVAVMLPTSMRLFPKDRFGQFCSFNAIVKAGFGIGASFVVVFYMMWMRHLFPDASWGKDFCYRTIAAWRIPFMCLALVFLLLVYREWKRLGGEKHYEPPGFDHEKSLPPDPGFEVVLAPPTEPTKPQ